MKKALLVTTISFLFVAAAHAQIGKGSVLLGGNIGFATSKDVTGITLKQNSLLVRLVVDWPLKKIWLWALRLRITIAK